MSPFTPPQPSTPPGADPPPLRRDPPLRRCRVAGCETLYGGRGPGSPKTRVAGKMRSTRLCVPCAAVYWLCSDCGDLHPRHALYACRVDGGYRCARCHRAHAVAETDHLHDKLATVEAARGRPLPTPWSVTALQRRGYAVEVVGAGVPEEVGDALRRLAEIGYQVYPPDARLGVRQTSDPFVAAHPVLPLDLLRHRRISPRWVLEELGIPENEMRSWFDPEDNTPFVFLKHDVDLQTFVRYLTEHGERR